MKLSYEEIIELDKNLLHIDDETFSESLRAEVRRHLNELFTDHGNFKQRNFDSHRNYRHGYNEAVLPWQMECRRLHEFLFDDVGNLREIIAHQLPSVIDERGFSWKSKAVHLHYADMHGQQTSGSYPATWMDK
jgi:hypothetical protein